MSADRPLTPLPPLLLGRSAGVASASDTHLIFFPSQDKLSGLSEFRFVIYCFCFCLASYRKGRFACILVEKETLVYRSLCFVLVARMNELPGVKSSTGSFFMKSLVLLV